LNFGTPFKVGQIASVIEKRTKAKIERLSAFGMDGKKRNQLL
jgi:hypothetical protein